jgi:hypothetical protein
MKNYLQFLNEIHVISGKYFGEEEFEFTIKKHKNDKELSDFMVKIHQYFDYEDSNRIHNYILKWSSYDYWFFDIWMSYGNAGLKRSSVKLEQRNVPIKYNFTISEFIELGFEGIKEYVEASEAGEKYNL